MTTTTTLPPVLSPAKLFKNVINSKATALGFTVFVNHMQDQPDKAILVFDGKGRLDDRTQLGNHFERPLVEVHVRAHDHNEAFNALPVIWEDVLKNVTATSTGGKIVQCISKANTIGCMGQEPQTRRWRFTQSFLMTII
jgi:hypothetical protein